MAIYFLLSGDSDGLLAEDVVKVGYSAGRRTTRSRSSLPHLLG
jgi:hypothetical protein